MLIAQITDFHIKARGRIAYRVVDTAACLAAAVAALKALDPRPDLVVATGDLTDFGREEEYALLRELLAPLAMPVYLIPGNHDEREAMRRTFRGDGYFPAQGFLNYTVEDHPLRLVALDTVIPGESGGRLCAERLAWLDRTLASAPERPTMILMHHPPFQTGIAHMDAIGLDGADAFAAVLARHPRVERVLCGHLHRSIQAPIGRRAIASTAPSTAHQVALDLRPRGPAAFMMEPPGYQLHLWRPATGVVTHTAVVGDFAGPYPFFEDGALIDS
ncbi:MAG TPA: phosphodiesterase [Stellaceae bacterium]|nr:phosphodiesterase [Stellaceae bacterium]